MMVYTMAWWRAIPGFGGGRSGEFQYPRKRVKRYIAENGYAYDYVFAGRREKNSTLEFLFQVTLTARMYSPVQVHIPLNTLRQWESVRDRSLTQPETYAVAKMLVFQYLDEASPGEGTSVKLVVTPEFLDRVALELDF